MTKSDTAPEPTTTEEQNRKASRRALFSGTLGTALEWFDFAAYGTLSATVFPKLFFPEFDSGTALLASFATFGAGMMARPLGGVVFGALGDRIGRRNVLMFTLVLMGASSVLIGLLLTYAAIGILAPTLLVILRFLQGFALGGEASGMQVMVTEHAPREHRGLYGGVLAVGSPLAQSLNSLVLTGLAVWLTTEQFESWGWRIPFIMGLGLLAMGVYIRRRLEETPQFAAAQAKAAAQHVKQDRALQVFAKEPWTLTRMIFAWGGPTALFWICVTYAVNYLTSELGYDNSVSFGLLLIGNLVSIPAAIGGGMLSDRIGRKKSMLVGLTLLAIAAVTMFPIMNSMNYPASVAVITLALCGIQIAAATQAPLFSEALPTTMRYTGSAIGMTFAGLIFGAPIPFVAAWLFQNTEDGTTALTILATSIVVLSAIAVILMPDNTKRSLNDADETTHVEAS